MTIVIAIIAIIGIFGVVVYFGLKKIKEITEIQDDDESSDPNITTAQEFLPFKEIKNGVIDMGGHFYVGILEVTSTNYFLRTGREQDRIDASFARFLNSLTHRIVIYTQTKEMDYSVFLKNMENDIKRMHKDNPKLGRVAQQSYVEMANLPNRIGNSKQKKKYILVPFTEASMLSNLNDEEKKEYSLTELRTRMNIVASGLNPIGIKATPLNTKEIVELIYSTYNRDHHSNYEHIFSGEHLTMFVDGENPIYKISDDDKADLALYEAQMRITNEIPKDKLYGDDPKYRGIIEALDNLRKQLEEDNKQAEEQEV